MSTTTTRHGSLTRAEATALELWDAGWSKQRIARETGIDRGVVDRAIGWTDETATRSTHAAIRTGSACLAAAIQREGLAL